jgi:hypothetical protein
MTNTTKNRLAVKAIVRRAAVAYTGCLLIAMLALLLSLKHGAGWRPLISLVPLLIILFGGVTYQFEKEFKKISANKNAEGDSAADR